MNIRVHRSFVRTLNAVCVLYLTLLLLSEIYTAAATALDDSHRFPSWEAKLGWWLLILPCVLVAGLVLLIRSARENLGFSLVGLSVLLYLADLFLENALAPEHMDRGGWIDTGIWVVFCVAGAAAGWWLKGQHKVRAGRVIRKAETW